VDGLIPGRGNRALASHGIGYDAAVGSRWASRGKTWTRLGTAALCLFSLGCATPAIVARARDSTTTETRATEVSALKSAERLESGALRLCLQLRDWRRKQMSVEIPLASLAREEPRQRTGFEFGRQPGFDGPAPDDPSTLRYVFLEEQLAPGCPPTSKSLPIYSTQRSASDRGPGMYTTRTANGLKLVYRSEKPIWSTLRSIELAPVLSDAEREVQIPGKPVYWLALPFALTFDALIAGFFLVGFLI
jgi:hypothetical protein